MNHHCECWDCKNYFSRYGHDKIDIKSIRKEVSDGKYINSKKYEEGGNLDNAYKQWSGK